MCCVASVQGGLKAVIWTDFFQAVVILGGLLTIVIKVKQLNILRTSYGAI